MVIYSAISIVKGCKIKLYVADRTGGGGRGGGGGVGGWGGGVGGLGVG